MKKYILTLLLIISLLEVKAQLVGKVYALPDSIPLSNVTVKLPDGQNIMTNKMGEFMYSPSSKADGFMTFSHLAYQSQSIKASSINPTRFKIYMFPSQNELAEVTVSTGYQLVPKERATGSFTTITSNKLGEQVGSNLLSRLEGVASGFSVDRKSNNAGIMIRGLSSINGPRSPLIILDNFPYEGNLDNLNPNDVANITILKDAAAASIWGARAGNGVIVITTKKAAFNSALQVQAGLVYQMDEKPNTAKLRNISVADFIATERFLFGKGYYTADETSTNKTPLTPVVELLTAGRDGKLSNNEMESAISNLGRYDLQKQYEDLMYRQSLNQQYNLSLSSGAEKINWNFSTAYDQNRSVLDSRYKRLNIKSAQSFKLTKQLLLNTQFIYTRSEGLSGKTDITELSAINGKLPPYTRLVDDYGNAFPVMRNYRLPYINSNATAGLLDWNYYPYTDYMYNRSKSNIADLVGSINLKYTILDGLDASILYQYEQQRNDGETLQQQEGYSTRNLINSFTQISGTTIKRPVPLGNILLNTSNLLELHQVRFQPSYNKSFGKHDINILAGSEVRSSNVNTTGNRSYGYNADLLKSVTVDYANTYPNFITGSNSYIPNGESFGSTTNHFLSFYANGAYTYDKKYTVSASARSDASNIFGVSTNDKWNPLWSVGLSWNIANESFFKSETFNALKLRGSYGISGNINPNMSALTTIGYSSVSPYTQLAFANFVAYANPELRWEKSAMLNLAIDFSAFNNRLAGSVEYFHKKGTDLYGRAEIDYTAGIGSSIIKNAAAMKGSGVDINLNSQNLTGKLKWDSDFFLNFYQDKVTDYYLTTQQGSAYLNGNTSIAGIKGYPVYSLFSYKWAGLNPLNGNPRGYLNGQISEDYNNLTGAATSINDLVYAGSALPKISMALGNSFTYGPVSLNFRLSAKFGYFFRRESISYINLFATRNGNVDFADRWQNSGDELNTNVPSMIYPANGSRDDFYGGSEATISKGDHIRLQYINLGYTFRFQKNKSKNIQLYLSANNLGILWQADPYKIDPDYLNIPPSKTFALGLKSNF